MNPEEINEFLAGLRKTIAESERLVEASRLRLDETDRMLASQGLTREQVLNMSFTDEQRQAVDDELRRRGLPSLDGATPPPSFDEVSEALRLEPLPDDVVSERSSKFAGLMHGIRL